MLDDELARLPAAAPLPGAAAFRLYDTYGFPLDLTQDALREKGQGGGRPPASRRRWPSRRPRRAPPGRARARRRTRRSGSTSPRGTGATEFLGYDTEAAEGQVLALVVGGTPVEKAAIGVEVQVVLNQTPFYAEQGGQVGDTGTLRTDKARVRITDVRKKAGVFVHQGRVEEGELVRGAAAELAVDHERRSAIRANHSATHLLHEALRRALGEHVAQRGSLVAPDRLRFDFAHPKAMTPAETAAVEAEVNAYVRQNTPVETRIMTPDAAERLGARALFGEKYGDEVRVVSMGDARRAAGSGPGATPIRSSSAAGRTWGGPATSGRSGSSPRGPRRRGVRRIEAVTGAGALAQIAADEAALAEAAGLLRARPEELAERVRALLDERKAQGAEIAELRRRLAMAGGPAEAKGPETVAGVSFMAQTLKGVSGKDLRGLIDEHKARLGSGVILLVADTGEKAAVAAGVTDDLTGRISAVDLVRVAAEALGGKGGGGRPDMAQAGGNDPARAPEAIAAARALLEA